MRDNNKSDPRYNVVDKLRKADRVRTEWYGGEKNFTKRGHVLVCSAKQEHVNRNLHF